MSPGSALAPSYLTPIGHKADDWTNRLSRYPSQQASKGIGTVTLAVFQSIGPTELIIVLVIVLVIFGPKRLPGLGRSLGSGMREFRDSVTGKGSDHDPDEDDEGRREANAALGRAEETPPVDGEIVSDRETSRS
jgi:sec-independent protein translocase protein TatA